MSLNIITVTLNMGKSPTPVFKTSHCCWCSKNKISAQIPTEFSRRFLQRNHECFCISKSNCDPFCILIIFSSWESWELVIYITSRITWFIIHACSHCGQTYVKYMFSAYQQYDSVDIINLHIPQNVKIKVDVVIFVFR